MTLQHLLNILFTNQSIGYQVIYELHLGVEQLSNFTPPRSYHQHFCRSIITEMNANQLNLFDVVVQYTKIEVKPDLQCIRNMAQVCTSI